jgi:mitogen-activated protein kinase 1/3
MQDWFDPADEPIAHEPFTFEAELDALPENALRELIWRAINDATPSAIPLELHG